MKKNYVLISMRMTVVIFFFISIFYTIISIYKNKSQFTETFNSKTYKNKFDQSQWIVTNKNKKTISDTDLYTHMAYEYMTGVDPTTQNFEVPPLGKYLIGGSILHYNNQRVFSLIFGLGSLIMIYYFCYMTTKSFLLSLLGPALTGTSWFFLDQIKNSPQLEIYQLAFLLIFFIFFSRYASKSRLRYLIISAISLGAFLSIKVFFIYYALIIFFFLIYYFLTRTRNHKIIFDLSILHIGIFGVYLLYYINFFLKGGDWIRFLSVQKWIIGFYSIHSNIQSWKLLGSYLPLIYQNQWHFWSQGYPVIFFDNWSILWPLFHLGGITTVLYYLRTKKYVKNIYIAIILSFTVAYSIFLLFVPIWPRYFLLLYIPIFILITFLVYDFSGKLFLSKK